MMSVGFVSVVLQPSVQDVEGAFAALVLSGPATGPAVVECRSKSFARFSSKLFTGALATIEEAKKLRVLAFLAEASARNEAPTKIIGTYKDNPYFVIDLGSGSSVYNTLQMDQSARVAHTVNDRLLGVMKASLGPLADLGGAASGIKLPVQILSESVAGRFAEPSVDVVQIYASREILQKVTDAEITSRQLIDCCVGLVNDNRVQVLPAGPCRARSRLTVRELSAS